MDHDQFREADLDRLLERASASARMVLDVEVDVAQRLRELHHEVAEERRSTPDDPASR